MLIIIIHRFISKALVLTSMVSEEVALMRILLWESALAERSGHGTGRGILKK